MFKEGLSFVLSVLLICAFIFGLCYGSYALYAFFAPRYQAVQYNTFKNGQSYNEGMIQELYRIQDEYLKAPDNRKAALAYQFAYDAHTYGTDKLPSDLFDFYNELKGEK